MGCLGCIVVGRERNGWTKLEGRKNKYGITVIDELIRRSRNDFMTSE